MIMDNGTIHDDDDAVRFIRNCLPQEMKEKFDDDDILYVIDLIYDFYDSSGFLSLDDEASVEINEEQLIRYVVKNARQDGIKHFETDEITFIVQGELDYCDSIHLFE
ncbi:MAG: hypothetical protein LBJ23_00175 [Tannerella sp.]|jgi:hypothetical protein|nr:hypothetical protein [Tannerella sp.]